MTYSVTIKENTKKGKTILAMLKHAAKNTDAIIVKRAIPFVKDDALAKLIDEGRKSGYANKSEVHKILGLE